MLLTFTCKRISRRRPEAVQKLGGNVSKSVVHKAKLGRFYRVQTSKSVQGSSAFVTRNMGSGRETITISKDAYEAAKIAASRAMKKQDQPA